MRTDRVTLICLRAYLRTLSNLLVIPIVMIHSFTAVKNISKSLFYCVRCGDLAAEIHEVIFGSLFRQISIEYNVQVPVCRNCHHMAHHSSEKQKIRDDFLAILCTSYEQIRPYYNTNADRTFLSQTAQKRLKIIDHFRHN